MFVKIINTFLATTGVVGGCVITGKLISKPSVYLFKETDLQTTDAGVENKTLGERLDGKSFEELKTVEVPFTHLLQGNMDFNKGNYVIYFGSVTCIHCTDLMYGNMEAAKGVYDESIVKYSSGTWASVAEWGREKYNLKFLMFEDRPDKQQLSTNSTLWTLPWNTKADKPSEYVRYDASAINFRKIFDYSRALYPNITGTPTIIFYKDGKANLYADREVDKTDLNTQNESIRLKEFIGKLYKKPA